MSRKRDDAWWLKRGRQRAAVAMVLRKPMTATEICAAARSFSPRIQLRDVWFHMWQLEKRELVVCLSPKLVTGRLYSLTRDGEAAVLSAFGVSVSTLPENINWRKYSWVIRAKVRRLTLCSLAQLETKTKEPQTATEIREQIRAGYAVGLYPVIRAVRELAAHQLIICVGLTPQRSCKLYRLTPAGRAIVNQLKQ